MPKTEVTVEEGECAHFVGDTRVMGSIIHGNITVTDGSLWVEKDVKNATITLCSSDETRKTRIIQIKGDAEISVINAPSAQVFIDGTLLGCEVHIPGGKMHAGKGFASLFKPAVPSVAVGDAGAGVASLRR